MKIRINGYELEGEAGAIRELLGFDECLRNLRNAEDDKNLKADVPKATKPKATKPKQTKRVDIDLGKVRALREGGWSVAAIADEMRVSEPTIRARLKEMSA